MTSTTATQLRMNLFGLLHDVIKHNEPLHVATKDGDAIIISEADYNALQETLYLVSIPRMRESIQEGMATPLDECVIDDGDNW